ncbi:hypothetical protein JD969_14495 [Planctomycetota bacterium]|nr:hypothetical protein JD969_14495 [Planctomycetota bacterium]
MDLAAINSISTQQIISNTAISAYSGKRDFNDIVARAMDENKQKPSVISTPNDLEVKVRDASEKLVASAFVLPILQKMQDDPFRSEVFHGGTAEDMFAQQWNTLVADDMVKNANFPMVDAVYNQIMNHVNTNTAYAESKKEIDINA